MVLLPFNPFSKPLSELETANLGVLCQVAEGWHVEYKRQVPVIRSVAKSLSAFANHYGGWLFYGVEEDRDTRVARSFPGVPISDLPSLEQTIRNAAAHHVHPPPHFDHRVLRGPCEQLGLSNDRAVIVIKIPYGPNAPYVHGSGVIYRRVADESDPKRETDRAVLDLLWERGRRDRSKLADFLMRVPRRSKGEENNSFVHLFLMGDPLGERGYRSQLTFSRFVELMKDSSDQSGGLPFDNIFTMAEGFIARQVSTNDPYNLVLTWRYYDDCSSVVNFPLSGAQISHLQSFLDGYERTGNLLIACRRQKLEAGWVLDLNILFHLLSSIICKHRLLQAEDGNKGAFYAKASLDNIWRRIPFLDTPGYAKFLSQCNIPVVQDETSLAPPGTDLESLVELSWREYSSDGNDDLVWRLKSAFLIFTHIVVALGLPGLVFFESDSLGELLNLLQRALEVQRRRSTS